ncbi:DUF2062 domain-containing protein [Peptococcaceae bacterium 1198_IL3148]
MNNNVFHKGDVNILKKFKANLLKLINIKDDPNKLAKSVSLGFFLSILPLPGLNLPIGIVLAKLLKLNIAATSVPALLMTYVSPFLYVFNYKVGTFFIASNERPPQEFAAGLTIWEKLVDFFIHAGPAYLLGCAINATLAAVMSYLLFLVIYKNASKIFTNGKKVKSIKFKKIAGVRARVGRIKNPKVFNKFKRKRSVSSTNRTHQTL